MNEQIEKLAEQAGYNTSPYCRLNREFDLFEIEKFAKLVADYAAAKEREACAKLCEDEADQISNDQEAGGMYWCAEKIRARSKHD